MPHPVAAGLRPLPELQRFNADAVANLIPRNEAA